MLNFPRSSSKQMSHYIDINLEGNSIYTIILDIGVNDLLNDKSQHNLDNLMFQYSQNNWKNVNELDSENVFGSGLMYTTRVSLPIVERVHNVISKFCLENACFYIDNRYIREFNLKKEVFIY